MLRVSELIDFATGQRPSREIADDPDRFAGRRKPPAIFWVVCKHCNMRCAGCRLGAKVRRARGDLETSEALRLLEQMAACGIRNVVFAGGEPLLRDDLFDLLGRARELGIAAQLSSNGLLIDERMAERLRDVGVASVGVSLEGGPEVNDRFRGLARSFDLAVAGLNALWRCRVQTGIRMTVSRHNAAELVSTLWRARKIGVDWFYASQMVSSGHGPRFVNDELDPSESRRLLLSLFEAALAMRADGPRVLAAGNDSGGPLMFRWVEARLGQDAAGRVLEALLKDGGNAAGETILAIDQRGHVHPDRLWKGVTLGDLRRDRLADVLDHPFRDALRGRAARLTGRCGRCCFVDICRGSHRERAIARYRDVWAPDPACVMSEREIDEARAHPAASI